MKTDCTLTLIFLFGHKSGTDKSSNVSNAYHIGLSLNVKYTVLSGSNRKMTFQILNTKTYNFNV